MTIEAAFDVESRERLDRDAKEIIARYPRSRSALLPLLHLVQAEEGYVSQRGIAYCAQQLGLTTAEVTAVSTFYTMFKRAPVGDYHVGVCINTLCAVMGGDLIWESLSEHVGVGNDEATEDGKVSLERVECNAACDYAPVMTVNWELFDNMTPERATRLVDDLRAGTEVAPSRGAGGLCTWKEASRILAGFQDGRAGEGDTAGHPSLVGLRLARERGWSAPGTDTAAEAGSGSEKEPT